MKLAFNRRPMACAPVCGSLKFVPPLERRAFTLIEVMIVIGIAAVVMAWGVPSVVQSFRKDALRRAVSDVLEGCSHARARAILQGTTMEFTIRAEDGSLSIQPRQAREVDKITGFSAGPEFHAGPEEAPVAIKPYSAKLSDDVIVELLDVNFRDHMQLGEARVQFHPNGTSDEFTVVLRTTDGGTHKVSLDILTGLAHAEKIR